MEGQINIFEFIKPAKKRTLNDYWNAEILGKPIRLTSEELQAEQNRLGKKMAFWFLLDVPKCCGCFPILKHTNSWLQPLDYAECIVCGKHTKPINDYSWQGTKKAWIQIMNSRLN